MKETTEKIKQPILLLITEIYLAIIILTIACNIIYKFGSRLFDWEMSWYVVKDIPYINLILPACLIFGIITNSYFSSNEK